VTHVWPAAQAFPQVPQLLASVWAFTQLPEQSVYPVAHTQAPLLQTKLVPQACPQAPQLLASLCMFTQVPLQVV
jgi:hypothetical protein